MKEKRKKTLIVTLFIISIILIALFVINYFFMPKIILKSGKTYIINYNEKYTDPGYKSVYKGKDYTDKVEVSGKVNSKKLGDYKVSYKININGLKRNIIRTVKVRDTEKPKIILKSTEDIYVCPGKKYQEEEYQAIDNYDGNITNKVKIMNNKDFIKYSVVDTSGNFNSITRNIKYDDITKPIIELIDGDYATVYLNNEYKDSGYIANDNCDGDITKEVEIIGEVDTTKTGRYELVYKVEDLHNNKDEKKRTVNVITPNQPGTIYLTFDDGPRMGTTNIILDILKEEGVKATFFVTNSGPDELIKREYDEGHSVALHTATHDYSYIYSSYENYFTDLEIVHQRVLRITGYDSRIIRFPGGSSNTISRKYKVGIMSYLTKEVLNKSYMYYDWNINSMDAGGTTDSNEVYQNVVNKLSKDKVNIVLMHDIKSHTRDALKQIIEYGKSNGYTFDKIQNSTEMITQKVNN